MGVPVLATERLRIRPLATDDLDAVQQLFAAIAGTDPNSDWAMTRAQCQRWLEWTALSYGELARLHQPPYGDRAIVLQQSDQLIGVCGYVPCLNVFGRLPSLAGLGDRGGRGLNSTEFGLYWAIAPESQRHGYATEAARALIDYAFERLHLRRVVATTDHENAASIGVMRRLGMRIDRNPDVEPEWLQVVGVLSHPSLSKEAEVEA
jgi:RimJ/RimL family protein N-acetyltransferase